MTIQQRSARRDTICGMGGVSGGGAADRRCSAGMGMGMSEYYKLDLYLLIILVCACAHGFHVGGNSSQLKKQSITCCEIGAFRYNSVVRRDRPYFELNKVHCIFELGLYAKIVQTFCELRT